MFLLLDRYIAIQLHKRVYIFSTFISSKGSKKQRARTEAKSFIGIALGILLKGNGFDFIWLNFLLFIVISGFIEYSLLDQRVIIQLYKKCWLYLNSV